MGSARQSRDRLTVGGYWHTAKQKYATVGMTRCGFAWSSQIPGPPIFINAMAGKFTANFRMRSSAIGSSK